MKKIIRNFDAASYSKDSEMLVILYCEKNTKSKYRIEYTNYAKLSDKYNGEYLVDANVVDYIIENLENKLDCCVIPNRLVEYDNDKFMGFRVPYSRLVGLVHESLSLAYRIGMTGE